ncbi:MAG: hypothetical protein AAF710_12380 [Planctomycetota bacterium]
MAVHEDDNLRIDLPAKWNVEGGEGPQSHCYHLKVGRGRQVFISFVFSDDVSTDWQYDHFRGCFLHPERRAGPWRTEIEDPYTLGPFTGFRTDSTLREGNSRVGQWVFALADSVLMVDLYELKEDEVRRVERAVAEMQIKPGYRQRMRAAWDQPERCFELDATDLSRPRRKQLKMWMDHQMVLLHDGGDTHEEAGDWDLPAEGYDRPIVPVSPSALFVTSRTEWGVTLEFVVRARPAAVRKRWWDREDTAALSLPSGELLVEMTTGGALLRVALPAGDYTLTVRGACPPGADAGSDGVERLRCELYPTEPA